MSSADMPHRMLKFYQSSHLLACQSGMVALLCAIIIAASIMLLC